MIQYNAPYTGITYLATMLQNFMFIFKNRLFSSTLFSVAVRCRLVTNFFYLFQTETIFLRATYFISIIVPKGAIIRAL